MATRSAGPRPLSDCAVIVSPRDNVAVVKSALVGGEVVALDAGRELALTAPVAPGHRFATRVIPSGSGAAFGALPALIRKQATVLLYGIGHGGAALELLNPVQGREAVTIRVQALLTHSYRGLGEVARAFGADPARPDCVKGVAVL